VISPALMQIALFGLAALSVGGVLYAMLYPKISGGSKADKRLESVAARTPRDRRGQTEDGRRRRSVEDTLREIEEKQKAKANKGAKPALTLRMRQAGLTWSKKQYIVICVIVGFAAVPLLWLGAGMGPLPALGFAIASGIALPYFYVNFTRKRRFKKFSNEFPNAVDVIVRGVKAGLPLIDCLKVIANEAQDPVRSEFQEIIEDQTLGLPLDEAVGRLPERIPLSEANFFAIVIAIQSRSGGSLSEALSNLSKVLRDRKKMQAKIRAMSQEAKSSAGIIGSLPIVVTVLVYMTSPDYINLLFDTTIGNVTLAICGLWMAMGVMVMRKMINFDF
jgi:tight adherence protein B